MFEIPSSVVAFGICSATFIIFGLHTAHINAIGIDEYTRQLMRDYHITAKQADERCRMQLFWNWFVIAVSAALGLFFLGYSLTQMIRIPQ